MFLGKWALGILLLTTQTSFANELSEQVLTKMKSDKITALGLAAQTDQGLVLSEEYGEANQETLFWSASMTKMLTATSILQLMEDGKLKLDDKITKFLPWWNLHPNPQSKRVTVRQLLTHTSGLTRDDGVDFWMNDERTNRLQVPTLHEQIKAFPKQEFVFKEGTRLKYSNYGFDTLGLVVAAACQNCKGFGLLEKYQDYVTKNVINKLGMKNSGFVAGSKELQKFAQPLGIINPKLGIRKPTALLPSAGASMPAWGLYSHAPEFSKFIYEIGKAARGKKNKLFKTDLSQLITVPVMKDAKNSKEGYSHGFMVRETPKGIIVGHTGTFLGFRSIAFTNISNGISAVVYANSTDVGREYYLDRVFAAVDGVPVPASTPSTPPTISKDFSSILGIEGKYISAMGIIEVYWREDKLILLTGGAEYIVKVEKANRRIVSLRLGEEGTFTAWNGERVDFSLNSASGQSTMLVGANSYRHVRFE